MWAFDSVFSHRKVSSKHIFLLASCSLRNWHVDLKEILREACLYSIFRSQLSEGSFTSLLPVPKTCLEKAALDFSSSRKKLFLPSPPHKNFVYSTNFEQLLCIKQCIKYQLNCANYAVNNPDRVGASTPPGRS